VKEAAREAIRRIQGRLGDAEAGRLSVVDGPSSDGGLSLPEGARDPVGPRRLKS